MGGNSGAVAIAKLPDDKNFCKLSDLQRMGVETTYWSVDADGEPVDYLDHTESDFYEEQFYCSNCTDHFDSWDEAKEHLNES
jgi:hypothetical protein